ncbi:MAG: phage baseplate assembly protein V [Acidimicrobiales bacterium]
MIARVYGRYLGTVIDNVDPKNLCRVRVTVPEVLAGQESGWCRPVTPYAGDGVGFAAVPPIGSLVLIEWPGGDVSREPLWTGATWSDGAGVEGAGPDAVVLVTPGGHRVELRDESGSEKVEIIASNGSSVVMDSNGMTLTFGSQKIAMTNQSISINDGALEVR